MSFDSLWEACRRAYIEHKSGDLCATCKNNYTKSPSLSEQVFANSGCVFMLCVRVCVAENPLHNLLTWHWSAPPAPWATRCVLSPPCDRLPNVPGPPVGILCNICDCLAACSSRRRSRHRHLTCCQSKCLWRTLHASQRLAASNGHFVASAKRFIQMNSEMTLQLTASHIAQTQPDQQARAKPGQQASATLTWALASLSTLRSKYYLLKQLPVGHWNRGMMYISKWSLAR